MTEQIIAAAIEVHRTLGPGLLESVCEEALCHELALRNVPIERQKEVDVIYKDKIIKGQRLDLVVKKEVVVEIKSVRKLDDVFTAQLLSYLKSSNLKRGLLINSGEKRLIDGVKRISLKIFCFFQCHLCDLCALCGKEGLIAFRRFSWFPSW
ncbi:MAG: GxxExxY protein [Nitrospiraceae bacterium]|nr:GxxExxY protein [Nitrospiraceae bacterium]